MEKRAAPTRYTAKAPNQVWSWDITYCASTVRGQYFYLYLIEDIYSRKIVGWEVHEQESGAMAAELLQRSVIREECFKRKRSFQHILPAPLFPFYSLPHIL